MTISLHSIEINNFLTGESTRRIIRSTIRTTRRNNRSIRNQIIQSSIRLERNSTRSFHRSKFKSLIHINGIIAIDRSTSKIKCSTTSKSYICSFIGSITQNNTKSISIDIWYSLGEVSCLSCIYSESSESSESSKC